MRGLRSINMLLMYYDIRVNVSSRQYASRNGTNLRSIDPAIHSMGVEVISSISELLHLTVMNVTLIVWMTVVDGVLTHELPMVILHETISLMHYRLVTSLVLMSQGLIHSYIECYDNEMTYFEI
jgi:hypothetical protein